ncbi:tetratricopeptide repeat-containing sulfotransferase family protein [Sphingomonas sp. PAMC 26605]|uniref:tetratricopeptide repeat-containing sulfotransferase family protein n=1 Tax=Sphingomonas sp. PAMC 26605 TaxID=1112214 RepID=UPI00026CCBF4|nr:tetratricopeptide repeat-containing sulfotransferase family protein [Sphingomonas sp. PAMC 26605]
MIQHDTAATVPILDSIAQLRVLQASGEHGEVLRRAAELLAPYPENRDLLLIEAVSLRISGRIAEALVALDRFASLHPTYSQMLQERGLCHVARKDAPAAIDALLRAVTLNPALPMSWRMLEGVYRLTRDPENAALAAAHVATLAALPHAVIAATALFHDGELEPAEQMIRAYLVEHGDQIEAMRLLAKIALAREVLDDAELLLASVLDLAPDHAPARREYAQCLVQRHKFPAAGAQLALLGADGLSSLDDRQLAATVAIGLGDHAAAIELYRAMLAEVPESADLHLWLGHALKTVGDIPEAIAAYRAAAAARADFGDAYWSLANLKTFRFETDEIARMRTEEARAKTPQIDRIHLCFALGKALEDRGEIAESWSYYERGNALQRASSRYRGEVLEANTQAQKAVCTPAFFAGRAGWGAPDRDPIFIVGLPRSGSTLIEQILASHSQVEGTQELPDIQRIVHDLQGRDPDPEQPLYPACLADLSQAQVAALGQRYLDETRSYRTTGRPLFIDKMPNNFRHIGLIKLILPNARIIDARREPMACCFSNLKQLFAQGQEFSYSIADIARYYRTYLDLMAHWDAVLPGEILRVHHEAVVDDLDGNVRRILAFCGLDFEPACLAFHQNPRSVRTPSSEQVRQPIFRDGLDQWKRFAAWLGPLETALGDAVTRYRS